ncbi:MAG TPA: DEAD/DEAH box helicase, partial [Symbiobacteriaceae bacterium]|nr:DEAD/DEAH box helicase [Symbiobacteriaceae bacterium]
RVVPVEGPKRRREWYWRCKVHVNLIGYETWREDLKWQLVDPSAFDLVILDEIQRIKNPDTSTHQAVARLKPKWRWGLSGTPLENRVEELLAVFAFLKPGLLPCVKGIQPAVVQKAIAPYVLRRRKVQVLQHLPPKESRVHWLELTPVQRWAYEAAEREGVNAIRSAGTSAASMIALALITKLKQICNLAHGGSCKMDFLERELARLTEHGEKVLVFSQYPEKSLKPLLPRFAPYKAALFDGSLTDWNRQLLVHRFQQMDDPAVLAMSLKCGGVGITLTRANHVYHFDSWWNPAAASQAEDRTHRIGQKKPVHVSTLLTKGTIEERVAELVEEKRDLFHKVMDPLTVDMEAAEEPAALGKLLTRDDLMKLFGVKH